MEKISGERIKRARKKMGLCQEELARALGVTLATLNRWEKGHNSPSRLAREKLIPLMKKAERKEE